VKGAAHDGSRVLGGHLPGSRRVRFTKGADHAGDASGRRCHGRVLDGGLPGRSGARVRSAEVAGKIARHLDRFPAWFLDGFGRDRVAAVTAREVASWRDHLAATAVRTLADGRAQLMAPAAVNNHLAHLSALFTWTAAHAPAGLLPHGDPAKGVDPLPLPRPSRGR
jgi:hypothetical protein